MELHGLSIYQWIGIMLKLNNTKRSTLTNTRSNILGHDPNFEGTECEIINDISLVSTPLTDITTDALITVIRVDHTELILY